jgi:hypothetical protein
LQTKKFRKLFLTEIYNEKKETQKNGTGKNIKKELKNQQKTKKTKKP